MSLGVTILQALPQGKFKFIASSGNSAERQNQLDVAVLPAGNYLMVPTSTGCRFDAYCNHKALSGARMTSADFIRPAVISIHSTQRIDVTASPFSPAIMEEAIELPIISKGTVTNLFTDGSLKLYTLKSGYSGVSFVAKNDDTRKNLIVTLDLSSSKNLISHRKALNESVFVPSREAKALHHLCPKDDSQR